VNDDAERIDLVARTLQIDADTWRAVVAGYRDLCPDGVAAPAAARLEALARAYARRSPHATALPAGARDALVSSAQHAFVNGIHLAVLVGATLAVISAGIVWRKLPHSLAQHGALHGSVEALEEVAAMGLGGVPPVFADEQRDEDRDLERDRERHRARDRERSA